jgi:hypothetical protein
VVLIFSKKWGSTYGDQVERGVQMISTRPGMCYWGGIDHLCLIATPEKKAKRTTSNVVALLIYVFSKVCWNVPPAIWTTTPVEHDIVSWQVCPGGNLKLMCLCMMAVECWCKVAQWCYCNCQMLSAVQIVVMTRQQMMWSCASLHSLPVVYLCNCYDRYFCTSAFVTMPRH